MALRLAQEADLDLVEVAPNSKPPVVKSQEEGREIETDLFVINADGSSGERRLTTTPGEDDHPTWSPDGTKIVFSSDRDAPAEGGDFDLYVMDADGGDVRRLTDSPEFDYWPDWSPDGRSITFTRTGEGGDYFDLWIMNEDGSERRILLQTQDSEREPAWSPDGEQIVFVCLVDKTGSDEICLMDADGRGHRVVTNYNAGVDGVSSPDWASAR